MEPQSDLADAQWEPTNRVTALVVGGPTAAPGSQPPHVYKTISSLFSTQLRADSHECWPDALGCVVIHFPSL